MQKPIYNHVSGLLDPPEETTAPKVLIIEGLHPFFDDRVSELCDYKIYLDISDEVKFAWKIQRDMKERGHSLESIKQSIEARKPDFDAYIDPQKAKADLVIQACPDVLPLCVRVCVCVCQWRRFITVSEWVLVCARTAAVQVLPTQLIPDEEEGKILRVRMIQKENNKVDPVHLFDEGSTISWIPCGRKLTCSFPGIKFHYGPDEWCVPPPLPQPPTVCIRGRSVTADAAGRPHSHP